MANTLEFIKDLADIKETAQGKGLTLTIVVRRDDNGLVSVNGKPVGKENDLDAARQVLEMLEYLRNESRKRQSQ